MAALTLNALKILNLKKILLELLSNGEKTKPELVLASELSNSTVSDGINRLMKLQLVGTCGEGESVGGRRPLIYHINKGYGMFLGIAQDEDGFSVAVTDIYNDVVEYRKYGFGGTKPIQNLYDIVHEISDEFGSSNILAIGIGLDGIIDSQKGIVISDKSLDWDNVHLKELLERRFLMPVSIDHRMNNVAEHEKIIGHARDINSFVCIFEECPERAGIFLNGTVYRGSHFASGKINDIYSLIQYIKFVEEFLNLERILYSYSSPNIKSLETINLNPKGGCNLVSFKSNPEIFAKAAALIAETEWFESSFFLCLAMDSINKGG